MGQPRKTGELKEKLDWLCAMGTMGDLGTGFKWERPFPDMRECLKKWTKKPLVGETIGLINARKSSLYAIMPTDQFLMHAHHSSSISRI